MGILFLHKSTTLSFKVTSFFVLVIFCTITKLIFEEVHNASKIVIDEEFHLPQGLSYCRLKFDSWNPKITTLPGLYFVSALFLSLFNACSVYWLRFINYAASIMNYLLIFAVLQVDNKQSKWKNLCLATNLSILPPLLVFGNLYYTDTVSLTFVLLMILLFETNYIISASTAGLVSITMRQTNILWVGMIFLQYCGKEATLVLKKRTSNFTYNDLKALWRQLIQRNVNIKDIPLSVWCNIFTFVAVFASFLTFLILNDGIVVGDKSAHVMTIHLVQLFYYLLFCLFFTWSYFLPLALPFLSFINKKKILSSFVILAFFLVVYFNTQVHPYLLADNRHYTFYIWNRFYQKELFRYLIIPVYYYAAYCFLYKLNFKNKLLFSIPYFISTTILLASQKMIEIRYFLVPYLIFRIKMENLRYWQLLLEFVFYLFINYITLRIFFEKEIFWDDFDYPQKLIW